MCYCLFWQIFKHNPNTILISDQVIQRDESASESVLLFNLNTGQTRDNWPKVDSADKHLKNTNNGQIPTFTQTFSVQCFNQ